MAKRFSNSQIDALYHMLVLELQKPRNSFVQKKVLKDYFAKHFINLSRQKEIQYRLANDKKIQPISLKWTQGEPFRKLQAIQHKINPLEIAMGFFEKGYLCFGSALFWNGLTTQIPKTFYIAKERPNPGPKRSPPDLDEFTLQEQFMKSPRLSSKTCRFQDYSYTLVERDYSGQFGVISKTVPFAGKKVNITLTNLERTLIDCTVSPHYSGGPAAIVQAFEISAPKLHIQTLISTYKKLSFIFPYWQRIGLILDKISTHKNVNAWKNEFGKPKMKFYFDKNYRLSWSFDEIWQIYYPKGLL